MFWKFPKGGFGAFELLNKPPLVLLVGGLVLLAPNRELLPFWLLPNKEGPLLSEEEGLLLPNKLLPKSPCPWVLGFLLLALFPKREGVLLVLPRLEKRLPPPELCPC